MRQKNQILLFSDAELSLIKNTFADEAGEEVLYLLRDALLQFPMTVDEKKRLKGVMNSEVYRIVRKRLLPQIDKESIMGNSGDLWQSLTNDLKSKTVDDMAPLFKSKELEIKYLEQQFDYLMDVERDFVPEIVLDDLKKISDVRAEMHLWYINTTARNFIIGYVEANLLMLKSLAGQKSESLEEAKKRLSRDSSK